MSAHVEIRPTPFFERVNVLTQTQKWMKWAGVFVVDVFTSQEEELAGLRSRVAIGDQSPLIDTVVRGPDALRLVNHLSPRELVGLEVGQAYYSPFADNEGKMVADGVVSRRRETEFAISIGAPFADWCRKNAAGFDVEIAEDSAQQRGILCIQGPLARDLLEAATGRDCSDIGFSRRGTVRIAECDLSTLRQGYTGELGYEIAVPAASCTAVWDAVWDVGADFDAVAIGNAATLVARVEAGLILASRDYAFPGLPLLNDDEPLDPGQHLVSPYELNGARFVDLAKPDFIGKSALRAEHDAGGPNRRFVGLEYDSVAMGGLMRDAMYDASSGAALPDLPGTQRGWALPVYGGAGHIGWATSLVWSPTLRRTISFARIDRSAAELGSEVQVDVALNGGQSRLVGAKVCESRFISDKRRR